MDSKLIILVFFIVCFCFIIFQVYEFILNYDYIVNFNKIYNNYEYASSPSYNYIDYSEYDPNDIINNVEDKWKCISYKNSWYGLSKKGLVMFNNKLAAWNTELDCITYIFDQTTLRYNNMCGGTIINEFCNLQNNNYNK